MATACGPVIRAVVVALAITPVAARGQGIIIGCVTDITKLRSVVEERKVP